MSAIANSAVLVKLNISVWGATKRNKQLEQELAASKNADPKATRLYDNLMVGSSGHQDIQKYAGNARLWHAGMTLPWDDKGWRLCPTSLFIDYKQQHNWKRQEFERQVNQFRVKYFSYRETAKEFRGDIFNEDDYPPVEDIMAKYAWNFAVAPVPAGGHLCIDLPEQEMQELRSACDDEVERRVQEAVKESERRLRKQLDHISEKCAGADDDGKRWHDTFVSNPLELCRMLKHMNVTKDPKLEEARKKLEEIMEGKTKEMFKDKPEVREEVKKEVDEIIKTYEW
jgi:hypothetical protein